MDDFNREENSKTLKEVLPKTGLVYSERGALGEVFCKPKILPLKSSVLEKLSAMEGERNEAYEAGENNTSND